MTDTTKAEYEGKMESSFKELGAKIDQLMRKAEATKDDVGDKLQDLKIKRENVGKKLEQLKAKTGDAWAELKIGMDQAWSDLGHAWEQVKAGSKRASQKLK
jgi:hypothetical protein